MSEISAASATKASGMEMQNLRGPPLKCLHNRRFLLLYHALDRTMSLNESQVGLRIYPNRSSGELKAVVGRDVAK